MYEADTDSNNFEWINADDAYRSIFSFARKSRSGKKNILFVCNFTPVAREDYRIGVPEKKHYKLIFNSDEKKYGGEGEKRSKIYSVEAKKCDNREYSFAYPLPAYGVAVFTY